MSVRIGLMLLLVLLSCPFSVRVQAQGTEMPITVEGTVLTSLLPEIDIGSSFSSAIAFDRFGPDLSDVPGLGVFVERPRPDPWKFDDIDFAVVKGFQIHTWLSPIDDLSPIIPWPWKWPPIPPVPPPPCDDCPIVWIDAPFDGLDGDFVTSDLELGTVFRTILQFAPDTLTDDQLTSLPIGEFTTDSEIFTQGRFQIIGSGGSILARGELTSYATARPVATFPGDFDSDGRLDATDIDRLSAEFRAGTNRAEFDVNGDRLVDQSDRQTWVNTLRMTYFGDSNLDGEFNSGDLVHVFGAGEYEDSLSINSSWSEGDWNGSGDFDSSDLVLAFQYAGYERGPRQVLAAVPEPSGGLLFGIAVLGTILISRRDQAQRLDGR
jgi:hypothetical protein